MRQIPDLEFRDDRTMEEADEITRVLRELDENRSPRRADLPQGDS
jgi:ribosome-binding factor A